MSVKLIDKAAAKIGPKMGRKLLKVKSNAPDIAVFVGLGAVIVGTGWLVKRVYDNSSKLDFYKQTIEEAKDENDMEVVKEARKDLAVNVLKTVGPPVAVITTGCAGVFYGRHLFKTKNFALVTANGVLQNKLTTLMERVDEEKGEGTAQEWVNEVRKVKIDEIDEKGKKKTKHAKTMPDHITGFALPFDASAHKFHKSPTLNRTTIMHAEESLNRDLNYKGVITGMDPYAELGWSEETLKGLLGVDKVKTLKKMHLTQNAEKSRHFSYQVFDIDAPWTYDNDRFIKGEESICIIDPNFHDFDIVIA